MLIALAVWLYLVGGFATATVLVDDGCEADLRTLNGLFALSLWPVWVSWAALVVFVQKFS